LIELQQSEWLMYFLSSTILMQTAKWCIYSMMLTHSSLRPLNYYKTAPFYCWINSCIC